MFMPEAASLERFMASFLLSADSRHPCLPDALSATLLSVTGEACRNRKPRVTHGQEA
jgi:hypothetical protein